MKDYVALWAEQLARRPGRTLRSALTVTGTARIVPAKMFAIVSLTATPSARFEVHDATSACATATHLGFPDWFIFGLLDVLMSDEHGPLTGLSVIIKDFKYHDVDTTREALVYAARDAGRQICGWSAPNPEPPYAGAPRPGAVPT